MNFNVINKNIYRGIEAHYLVEEIFFFVIT